MLSRLFTIAAGAALVSGGVAALASGASAAPLCLPNACAHSVVTIPGSGGTATGGAGKGGGGKNTGPGLGCPTVGQQLTCNLGGNAPAAVRHVPTIEVVYDARDKLAPPAPHIHTSPDPRTYVEIRTELSLDPGDVAGPTAQATTPDGGQTVTVTASDPSVTWNTGEGTVTCSGARCGHTYRRSSANQASGEYPISATVTWHKITWTCAGDCDAGGGTMIFPVNSPTTTAALAVGEIQTESRPG